MSNLAKLDIAALDITGKNYLVWVNLAETRLKEKNVWKIVVDKTDVSGLDQSGKDLLEQKQAKALAFLHSHIHEDLQIEYLAVKDPFVLWGNLKERFEHMKMIILPKARYNWVQLRFQDFKTVAEYNSALHKITSQMSLCGEIVTDSEMIEKTVSTFHPSCTLLQKQYRAAKFTKYSELISYLLVEEQNDEILMKNHHLRPTGSVPLPEAHGTTFLEENVPPHNRLAHGRGGRHGYGRGNNQSRGRGRGRGHGYSRGRGQGRNNFGNRGGYHPYSNNNTSFHQKWDKNDKRKGVQQTMKKSDTNCYKCGMIGHWSRNCRTAPHLVNLYQASIKGKGKEIETHFTNHDDSLDFTHLDVADFLIDYDAFPDPSNDNKSV